MLGLAAAEPHGGLQLVAAGSQSNRQLQAQWHAFLLPRRDEDLVAAVDGSRQGQHPFTGAGYTLARVVENDELLLDRLAGKEVVVLAGEAPRLAADVGQQR